MSFDLRSIREVSNEPQSKFVNQLAKKLSKFINEQQTEKLESKEDIYSIAQDVESVIRLNSSLSSTKQFTFLTQYFPPFEPDGVFNTCWIKCMNTGNTIRDRSTFGNIANINGDVVLVDGSPFDLGIHTGGTKSIVGKFNRPTSVTENREWLDIADNTNMAVSGISTGISYFIRFKIFDLDTMGGKARTLFEKTDDATPSNGVQCCVTETGRIRIFVKRAGTEYKWMTASSTIATDTVYELWVTYANSGNTVHVYVNNVDKTLSANTDTIAWHSDLTDKSTFVFKRGTGTEAGYLYGDLYDYMVYREKVISATEVGHHYTNKWTIADIPYGQVMVTDYWATYNESPSSTSFTSTSFTSTSFTT